MSKKSFTLLIIVIVALFALLGWYLYTRNTEPGNTNNPNSNGSDLFPFGNGGNNQGTSTGSGSDIIDLTGDGEARLPRLRQISFVPTAGAVASSTASSTIIRYIERATGHIYETDSEKPEVTKISTITIPKVYEGLFTANATKLLIRYLKEDSETVRTFYAKIATTTQPEQAIEGLFLPDNMKSVSVYGNNIFYLVKRNGAQQGIVADMDGSYKTAIFDSTFGDWTPRWTTPNLITLYPRPSSAAQGASYILNATTGTYTKTVGDVSGLETLTNSDGSLVLFSGANGDYFATSIFNTKTGAKNPLSVKTLAGKCVWSKKEVATVYCAVPQGAERGSYPDDWYKGKTSFNDSLWKIDTATGETEEILSPELSANISMDITSLSVDQKENVIIFTNKKDMTVWRFNLVE